MDISVVGVIVLEIGLVNRAAESVLQDQSVDYCRVALQKNILLVSRL